MAWNAHKVPEYKDKEEKVSWQAGYSDGYYGYKMFTSQDEDWHRNAYSKGYWEGQADAL